MQREEKRRVQFSTLDKIDLNFNINYGRDKALKPLQKPE